MTTAGERLVYDSGLAGSVAASVHLIAMGAGATAGERLVAYSGLGSNAAYVHLLAEPSSGGRVSTGGGGGTPNKHPLPQYYSRKVLDERVSLPQDPKSNEIAHEVLADALDIEKRLAKQDDDYTDMLEIVEHLLKQVAAYIESQQIYNIVRTLQSKVQARRDGEIAEVLQVRQSEIDDAEFQELIQFI